MGVYWSLEAADQLGQPVEIVDLRSLLPLDEEAVFRAVRTHNRCMIVTEEPTLNSFARNLAGRIQEVCFASLDAPIRVVGAQDLPAIPLNSTLESTMLPNAEKVGQVIRELIDF
jgi:2-oxoisovalerate dehydrogenase E1 component